MRQTKLVAFFNKLAHDRPTSKLTALLGRKSAFSKKSFAIASALGLDKQLASMIHYITSWMQSRLSLSRAGGNDAGGGRARRTRAGYMPLIFPTVAAHHKGWLCFFNRSRGRFEMELTAFSFSRSWTASCTISRPEPAGPRPIRSTRPSPRTSIASQPSVRCATMCVQCSSTRRVGSSASVGTPQRVDPKRVRRISRASSPAQRPTSIWASRGSPALTPRLWRQCMDWRRAAQLRSSLGPILCSPRRAQNSTPRTVRRDRHCQR